MSCELKELKPEDVEVGDLYFTPEILGRRVVPARVVKVREDSFSYETGSGGAGTQYFRYPIDGILMKEKEGRLELFVGKEFLESLDILEKLSIQEELESQ